MGSSSGATWEKDWHVRFDHAITDSNTISFNHYGYNRVLDEGTTVSLSTWFGDNATRMWSIQDSHMFSPTVINEFTFGTNDQGYDQKGATTVGNTLIREFGIDLGGRTSPEGPGCPQIYTGLWGFQPGALSGSFSATELTFPFLGRCGAGGNSSNPKVWVMKDNVSVNKGTHLIKFGVEANWERPFGSANSADAWGIYRFTGPYSGSDIADFLAGNPPRDGNRHLPRPRSRPWLRLRGLRPGRLEGDPAADHDLRGPHPTLRRAHGRQRALLQLRLRQPAGGGSRPVLPPRGAGVAARRHSGGEGQRGRLSPEPGQLHRGAHFSALRAGLSPQRLDRDPGRLRHLPRALRHRRGRHEWPRAGRLAGRPRGRTLRRDRRRSGPT